MQSLVVASFSRNSARLVPLDFRIFKILALNTRHEAPQTFPPPPSHHCTSPQRPFSNTVNVRSSNTPRNQDPNTRHATKIFTRASNFPHHCIRHSSGDHLELLQRNRAPLKLYQIMGYKGHILTFRHRASSI